ncbi:hypothetical protein DPMN_095870 [Dreissena polymorpha]|uniref:Uncharacterized protein n=1 Tax=Dreissena polymorpha TaxID=45954 RepID=A0A9D4R3Z8_DREPO|nr:hypothetical protein DPMN_095870 [Dreissena polymorpha]
MEGGLEGALVVAAAFCIQILAFGTSQSIGIYNIEWLRYFDSGAAAVSLVGSINLGVFLGAGMYWLLLLPVSLKAWTSEVSLVLGNIGFLYVH